MVGMAEAVVTEIATTEETDLPVFEVQVGEAYANVICNDGTLWVPHCAAPGESRLKDVIDRAVKQFGLTRVKFSNVINPALGEKLDGFEEVEEQHPAIDESVTCLVGEWEVDRDG